jgi:hypothetical protein
VLGLIAAAAGQATAQRWQVDLIATQARFDTSSGVGAATLAPAFEWQPGPWYALASGSMSGFGGGDWSSQAEGDVSLLLDPLGRLSPFRLELAGSASGTYHSTGLRTAATRAEGRLHWAGQRSGAWAGASAATGWTSAEGSFATASGLSAGAWGGIQRVLAGATIAALRIEGQWFPEANARLGVAAGPLDLSGYAGWRGAPAGSGVAPQAWGGLSAVAWLGGRVALFLAGGSYPADLLQGLPRGRYASAGIRLANLRPRVPILQPILRPIYHEEQSGGLLRFELPAAQRVEIAGDWTGWEPVPLQRESRGRWVLRVTLPAGVHRFNLIVDGEWTVPPGVTSVPDGFGGRTGLLIVP